MELGSLSLNVGFSSYYQYDLVRVCKVHKSQFIHLYNEDDTYPKGLNLIVFTKIPMDINKCHFFLLILSVRATHEGQNNTPSWLPQAPCKLDILSRLTTISAFSLWTIGRWDSVIMSPSYCTLDVACSNHQI